MLTRLEQFETSSVPMKSMHSKMYLLQSCRHWSLSMLNIGCLGEEGHLSSFCPGWVKLCRLACDEGLFALDPNFGIMFSWRDLGFFERKYVGKMEEIFFESYQNAELEWWRLERKMIKFDEVQSSSGYFLFAFSCKSSPNMFLTCQLNVISYLRK